MPGSYSQIPTADQVNNYDGSGGDGSSSTQQHHHHKHHHKHYPKHPKNYGDCIKGPNDKACLNGGSAVENLIVNVTVQKDGLETIVNNNC